MNLCKRRLCALRCSISASNSVFLLSSRVHALALVWRWSFCCHQSVFEIMFEQSWGKNYRLNIRGEETLSSQQLHLLFCALPPRHVTCLTHHVFPRRSRRRGVWDCHQGKTTTILQWLKISQKSLSRTIANDTRKKIYFCASETLLKTLLIIKILFNCNQEKCFWFSLFYYIK